MKLKVLEAAHKIVEKSFPHISYDEISIYITNNWDKIIGDKLVEVPIYEDVALLFILSYERGKK